MATAPTIYAPAVEIPAGSIEHLHLDGFASGDLDGDVELSATPVGGGHFWVAAEWVGAVGKARSIQSTAAHTWAPGRYHVCARVVSGGEYVIFTSLNAVTVK